MGPTQIADAVHQTIIKWITVDSMQDKWSHIRLHVQNEREAKLFRSMYCQTPEGQQNLRALALVQASRKTGLSVTKVFWTENRNASVQCTLSNSCL